MNKIDVSKVIGNLANVGVVVGLVFLGIELRQNNEAMTATVRASRAASSQGTFSPFFQSAELAEALAHATGRDAESILLGAYVNHTFIGWQYTYGEYQAGELDVDDLPVRGWIGSITSNPFFESAWARASESGGFNSEFVEYVDSHLKEFRESH